MSKQSLTDSSLSHAAAARPSSVGGPPKWVREPPPALTALPAAFAALLIVLSTWWDGAFAIRHWAPPALFVLVVLLVLNSAGAVAPRSRPLRVALAALWGLALWIALSALWSESPGGAWEAANRTVLYAALASLAVTAVPRRREGRLVAAALVGGVALVALLTLARLVAGDLDLFLAGRLDGPVGYRNATALLFALSFWPLVSVAATRGVRSPLRGLCLGLASLAVGLTLLTQSRGVLFGLALAAIVAIGAGPDRVRRAWTALLALGLVAVASPLLLKPYHAWDGGHGSVGSGDLSVAGVALASVLLLSGLAGLFLALLDNGLRASEPAMGRLREAARAGLVVVVVLALAAGLVAVGNPASYARDKWDDFRTLHDTLGTTRLTATGGQRYDLWRVAWHEFESAPIQGTGGGSYPVGYYRERATDRNLSNPHSLVFWLLAELGLVGTALFAAFLGGLGWSGATAWRSASLPTRRVASALAAAGVVVIGQAVVDWTWLIPGVTGIGFVALGLAAAVLDGNGWQAAPALRVRLARAACLGVAALGMLTFFLSDFELRRARATGNHSAQVSAARDAERLNPVSLRARWLQASALETKGDRRAARRELRSALDLEPKSFVTLALLGDLEVRAGHRRTAIRYYGRAWRLNPRDMGLRKLARGEFGA